MLPQTDINITTLTMRGEARNQGNQGMIAVGCVIRNRVNKGGYGEGYIGVCLEPKQFSCWNQNDPNLKYMESLTEEDVGFQAALPLAMGIINDDISDITAGALNYYSGQAVPYWATGKIPCAIIGAFKFFRNA